VTRKLNPEDEPHN